MYLQAALRLAGGTWCDWNASLLRQLRNISRLGEGHVKDSVVVSSGDVLLSDVLGHPHAPRELAVTPLHPVVLVRLLLRLLIPLTADGQHSIVEIDVDVLLLHTGQFSLDQPVLVGF